MNCWTADYGYITVNNSTHSSGHKVTECNSLCRDLKRNEVLFLFEKSFKENFISMLLKVAFILCLQFFVHHVPMHMSSSPNFF